MIPVGRDLVEVYIDDVIAINTACSASVSLLESCCAAEVCPIKPSKYKPAQPKGSAKSWGVEFDEHGCIRPPSASLSALVLRSQSLLSSSRVRRSDLATLVGKWLWFSLLMRPLLSIMGPLFRLVRVSSTWLWWWPSARTALRMLISVAPLIVVDPARPLGHLLATDASMRGGGVAVAPYLSLSAFSRWSRLCYYAGRSDLIDADYHGTVALMVSRYQFSVFGFLWRETSAVQEHITIKEGRAFWTGLRRVVFHTRGEFMARHIALVDNLGVVGAWSKGRSRNPILNQLIQRSAAVWLATGGGWDIVWCPTAYQPADAASRRIRF